MTVVLIARFGVDVERLTHGYDEAHRLIMERGGPAANFDISAPSETALSTSLACGNQKS